MTTQVYRIAYININGLNKEYLCEDERVKLNDYVLVEDESMPVKIDQIKLLKEDELTCQIQDLKSVVSIMNIKDQQKRLNELKVVSEIKHEFSYIDYHADCIMKIKDDTYSTDYSLIKSITLVNHSDRCYNDLKIKITFSNETFRMNDILIKKIDSFEELVLRIPFLKVDRQYIENLSENESASVIIELIDENNNNVLNCEEYNFMILPISQPSAYINKDNRLYAKFVTPLAPKVKQIALNAVSFNKYTSIIAYQNNDYNTMLEEAQAIYLALHDWGIVYQNPPARGFHTQRVRMPEEVLKDKKGTCLDLAILFCACLEEVGFNPILIIIDGHAFAGFFLDKNLSFSNAIEYQCGKVYNLATGGMNKIVLVECTSFTATKEQSFKQAISEGIDNIKMYDGKRFNAIDIHLAHKGIFSPIPTQGNDGDLELMINPKEIKDKDLNPIVETKYVDVLRKEEKDRFTFWERKLLDLTEANPLVNFKMKSSNCLKMTSNSKIEELLITNENIKFIGIPKELEENSFIEKEFAKVDIKPSDIYGENFDKNKILAIGYDKTLKNLIKKSNAAMDETGAPTLYLCLGMLTYNRKKGDLKGHAPFMVLPIKITKDKLGPYSTITYDYEDVMINQTFFEYYKQEHPNVDFSELYQINSNDKYMDIVHAFKANNTEDIQLNEEAFFIANLTFSHYIMWLDIRKRKEELKKNKVIHSILENKNMLEDNVNELDYPIDELEKYYDFAAPLPYDSTQLKAILKCGEAKSFILDGPPGTGKSQTIVNMIVNAFYHGKTVLFVAEKKAALDVVADRLRKLGDPSSDNNLGRFCLELHSNKANKTQFFEKLKSSMELGVSKNPEEFEQKCYELETRKKRILSIINKMHEKRYYYSLYDAIVRQKELEELSFYDEFEEDYLLSLTDEKRNETYNLIDEYISTASHINDFNNNPLKVLKIEDINFYDRFKIINEFNDLKNSLQSFLNSYKEMSNDLNFNFNLNNKTIKIIMETLKLCFNENLYFESLSEFMKDELDDNIQKIFDITKELLDLKNKMKEIYCFDKLSLINAELALNDLTKDENFFNRFKTKYKWKKVLKEVKIKDYKIKMKDLVEYYKQIENYNSLYSYLKNNTQVLSKLINDDYMSKIDEVNRIENEYYNTRKLLNNLKLLSNDKDFLEVSNLFLSIYLKKDSLNKLAFALNDEKLTKYIEKEKNIFDKYNIDYKTYENMDNGLDKFIELLEYVSDENNFSDLIDIAKINKIVHSLEEKNLSRIVQAIIENKIDYNYFKEIYDLSCVNGYIKLYFKDDDINYFNQTTFEDEVKKYKELINEYNNLVVACVSAKLTKNLNHQNINYAHSSPIGRLKKAISSNGRGVTIRETLLNYDEIIKKYFPCFLMSPLSAAQYLAVDENSEKSLSKFDLVIFDEASQIPTHEAVGPIARGKSLIVAGDPEQMPPSAYFSAGLELAENEVQYEDAISLLDECIAIELPRIRLSYHYRSKHESLISFSNHNFYNDNLYTFPSADISSNPIEFNFVELKEDKKDSSLSKEEIKMICTKFKDAYMNEKTKGKSVGVIVFNMKQQEKVYDAITELIANDDTLNKTIEENIKTTNEPWFVKSLENVQGDERDIVILSIGFRKNSAGRAIVIGPIIRQNGQRRLNVAVTRSKEKMIVISTIKYTDFDEDSMIKNKGQLLLKNFLKYAEENNFKTNYNFSFDNKETIIYFIKKDLESRGLKVVANVGNSDFKVDLAIMDETGKAYELGVLVDSKSLGDKISCRDKLYVQDSMLNSLKWKIINVYSLEYFKNSKRTIDRIIKAMDQPYIKDKHYIDAHIEKEIEQTFSYKKDKYTKVNTNVYTSYDNDYGYDSHLEELLQEIIETESPISFELIKTRVREHSNILSMSSKAKNRLEETLNFLSFNITHDQTQLFYWSKDSSVEMEKYRVNGDRDLYDISKEEIICIMKQILEVQGQISQNDLFKCVLEAFEYGQAVLSKKNQERLEYVYNWAKKFQRL